MWKLFENVQEAACFAALVVAGVAARLFFHDVVYLPNFAPVAAIALFAGFYFRNRLTAVAAPLLVMAACDFHIGGYHPTVMFVVYGMLAFPVLLGGLLRPRLGIKNASALQGVASAGLLIGLSVAGSVAFFLVTNLAVWASYSMYEHTAAGLSQCYLMALPFFRYTLAGDLLFAIALFGGHAMLQALNRQGAEFDPPNRGLVAEPVRRLDR